MLFRRIISILVSLALAVPCLADEKYNLTFNDGDTPWENHIFSEINTTYEEVLNELSYLRELVCSGDSTDLDKHPYGSIPPICLQGQGAKMVIPRLGQDVDYYVFYSPPEGGLFEQEHMARKAQLQFYDETGRIGTKYFLVPFDGDEIPTCFPKETMAYLPLWKKLFLKRNRMSEEYYNDHIRVMATSMRQSEWDGEPEDRFQIHYYYHVDWAYVKLQDGFSLNKDYNEITEVITGVLSGDDIYNPGLWSLRDSLGVGLSVSRVSSTHHIAGRDVIRETVMNKSPLLFIDVNKHLRLNDEGELILKVYGIENEEENKCLVADMILKDGAISEIRPVPCFVR
jgi:hypothetical protein